MSKFILVLGTPRSGTSCVAGVVHHLGIPMGDDLLEADEWNPAGYFQDREFETICAEELKGGFPDWDESVHNIHHHGYNRIKNLARIRAQRGIDWGVKSNRLAFFLEALIEGAQSTPTIISTSRHEASSIASWHERTERTNFNEAERVIKSMKFAIERSLARANLSPTLIVDFDQLIDDPTGEVQKIASSIGRESTTEAVSWVNKNLRRFISG